MGGQLLEYVSGGFRMHLVEDVACFVRREFLEEICGTFLVECFENVRGFMGVTTGKFFLNIVV